MQKINKEYERRHTRNIKRLQSDLSKAYGDAISSVSFHAEKIKFNGQVFDIRQFPTLRNQIDREVLKLNGKVYGLVTNGIKESWNLSEEKNNKFLDARVPRRLKESSRGKLLYDPNREGLKKFLDRKEKGLGLSDRVWKSTKPFAFELEKGLGIGISEGRSAKEMAKDLKEYMKQPDRLFRRVREKKGDPTSRLRLSEAAEKYNPGQGVYRSSYKNAHRLTRSETNMAYRKADNDRWKDSPFIIGVDINLSNNHPKFDICDLLQGRYPKDFDWTGWHPQCMCNATPAFVTDEEFERLADSIYDEKVDVSNFKTVSQPPAAFNQYVRDNRERLEKLKSPPYWVKDNEEFIKAAQEKRTGKVAPGATVISNQFNKIEKPAADQVKVALEGIDAVHGDGIMNNIPFKVVTGEKYEAALTTLLHSNEPLRISVSSNSKAGPFALTHEIGHLLDLMNIGTPRKWGSETKGDPVYKVVEVARKSDLVKSFEESLKKGFIKVDGKKYQTTPHIKKYLHYVLEGREIWARAYSQFIAKRSGNKTLLKGLAHDIAISKKGGLRTQWYEDDFKEIDEAIEDMMLSLGWMINR